MVLVSIFVVAYSTEDSFRRDMTNCERLEYMRTMNMSDVTLVQGIRFCNCVFNQIFNENRVIVMPKSAAGRRACGRAGVNFWFRLNKFSLLWTIDIKLAIWVAYIKRQLGNATQVSVIKVNVLLLKTEIQFPLNNEVALAY